MIHRISLFVFPLVFVAACGGDGAEVAPPAPPVATTSVYTSTYPLAWFAERIGGELVDVEFPIEPGTDPANWSPNAETVLAYQQADLILLNGAGYDWWATTASLPANRTIDTSAGFADDLVVTGSLTHSHGNEGEHSHDQVATVTWLDPSRAVRQAEAIRDALIAVRPEGTDRFHEGFTALAADLREIETALEAATTALGSHHLLAASRDYAYLGDRFDLEIAAIHYDPSISVHDYAHEVEHGRDHSRTMLWPAAPPEAVARELAELGVRVVVFDLAAAAPAQGDYLSVMTTNAAALRP